MCHESACHSNISKISQIRIFKANPGATFFFYDSNHFVTGPTYQPRMVAAAAWAPTEGGSGDPHPGPAAPRATPLRPNERNRGRRRAVLRGFCRSIGAAGRALRQAWAVPAGLQAGDQRLQKETSSAAGGGQRQLRTAPGTTLPAPLPTAHPAPCSCRTQGSMESEGKNNNVLSVTLSCCLGFLISRFHSAAFHPRNL